MQLIGMLDSPYVRRVAISLQLLGVRFEHRSLSVFRTFAQFQQSPDELVFKVNRSQVLTGCSDFTWKLKKVDDKTMKAQLTEGRVVTLTRN